MSSFLSFLLTALCISEVLRTYSSKLCLGFLSLVPVEVVDWVCGLGFPSLNPAPFCSYPGGISKGKNQSGGKNW